MEYKEQELQDFLRRANAGEQLGTPEDHQIMAAVGDKNRELTARLNSAGLSRAENRAVMSQIIGQELGEDFTIFPPFTADFGRNIHIGRDVFINSGARFQDQGGIYIGDNCFIGHNAVITTLNHELEPEVRHLMKPAPVHLENGVWLGANVTILPGVTIGQDAVVGAGSVVTRDVPARAIVGGVPAKVLKNI